MVSCRGVLPHGHFTGVLLLTLACCSCVLFAILNTSAQGTGICKVFLTFCFICFLFVTVGNPGGRCFPER